MSFSKYQLISRTSCLDQMKDHGSKYLSPLAAMWITLTTATLSDSSTNSVLDSRSQPSSIPPLHDPKRFSRERGTLSSCPPMKRPRRTRPSKITTRTWKPVTALPLSKLIRLLRRNYQLMSVRLLLVVLPLTEVGLPRAPISNFN